jgi:hypothetical protein
MTQALVILITSLVAFFSAAAGNFAAADCQSDYRSCATNCSNMIPSYPGGLQMGCRTNCWQWWQWRCGTGTGAPPHVQRRSQSECFRIFCELELRHLERDSQGDNEQKRCAHHRQRHRRDVQPIPI